MNSRFGGSEGFTLIETVVSLLLLAVVSVMSYQAVDAVVLAYQRAQSAET